MKIPFYGKKKLRLAFEYGLTLSNTMHEMKQELTFDIVSRAEDIMVKEFSTKTASKVACEMTPNLMASIEPK